MQKIAFPSRNEWEKIVDRPLSDTISLENTVNKILTAVKERGDHAIREFSLQFDKAIVGDLMVGDNEMNEAASLLPDDLKAAIGKAKKNIESFHSKQLIREKPIETSSGVECWRKSVAI